MIPEKFENGESFLSFKYRNLHWWVTYGINSDSPKVRTKYWQDFLDRNKINLTNYKNKTVGEVCCGLFGGIIGNIPFDSKWKVLIDIFMSDFQKIAQQLKIKYPDNASFVTCPVEEIDLYDNGLDFLLAYNSLDHGWDIKKALQECIRVSKECLISFDCRYVKPIPIQRHSRITKYPPLSKVDPKIDRDHFQKIDADELKKWLEKYLQDSFDNKIVYRINILNIKTWPTIDIYIKKDL